MEYVFGLLGLIGVVFLAVKVGGRDRAWTIYNEREVLLAADQKAKEKELVELEKAMESLEMRFRGMTPEEIEDYWNDKDNT